VLENKERWLELCALAAEEQDSAKLMELVTEISALLDAKEQRLKGKTSVIPPSSNQPDLFVRFPLELPNSLVSPLVLPHAFP